MTRTLTALLTATLALAGCSGDDTDGGLDAQTEAAAHETLDGHLQAMMEGDWERVYDLTADEARPNDRSRTSASANRAAARTSTSRPSPPATTR